MRKGSCAYVAALLEIKPVQVVEVCDVVLEVLQDVADRCHKSFLRNFILEGLLTITLN